MENGDLLWGGDLIQGRDKTKSFFHLYTFNEMLEDIGSAGYKILDFHIPEEYVEKYQVPYLIKKEALSLYFVLQKK